MFVAASMLDPNLSVLIC